MKLTNKVLAVSFGLIVVVIFIFLLSFKLYVRNNLGITPTTKREYSNYVTEEYDFTEFSALKLEYIEEAVISSGDEYKISISKPKEVPLEVDKNGAVLEITTDSEYSNAVEIEVTMPELVHFFSKGHTETEMIGFDQPEISIALDNNNDISTEDCQFNRLSIKSKGVIDIDFQNSMINDARLECEGFGDIRLKMDNGDVSGRIDGAIDLYIYGSADYRNVKQNGLVKIKVID